MSDGFYTRACAFTLRDDSAQGDGLTLEGYAAVFDSPTLINDWDGEYEETIASGAFKRTINARKPVLQFDHGQHPVLGSLPIGAIEALAEDTRGLFVRARLLDNWMTEPLRQAITAGAVDGMSFRFQVVKDVWQEPTELGQLRKRTLKEVRLYELGPVVFPAYADTTVALRSLAAVVPGLTLTVVENRSTPPADTAQSGTSDEPAAEARSTSDEPAATDDPAPKPLVAPSTSDERKRVARQVQAERLLAGKK
jgi:HK97 family phage prohead protease